jgi:predicted dienelactone hydrolase
MNIKTKDGMIVIKKTTVRYFSAGGKKIIGNVYPVASRTILFEDPGRQSWNGTGNRPLLPTLWYPGENIQERDQRIGIFKTGKYALAGLISLKKEKYPLILLSHGTGGSAAAMAWFAVSLARHGYIVAAVNRHGNTAVEDRYLLPGFVLWWERPQDITKLLDELIEDSAFGHRIDQDCVGVAGFSLGGYTALASVGARLDVELWKKYSEERPDEPLSHLPPEANFSIKAVHNYIATDKIAIESIRKSGESYKDQRIKAAYLMAPVLGPVLTAESLNDIDVPVALVVGDRDNQSLWEKYNLPLVKSIPNARMELLKGVSHYSFLSEGTLRGNLFASQLTWDGFGIRRASIHQHVSSLAYNFFENNWAPGSPRNSPE